MIRRPPTVASGGMLVASHPLAAQAGSEVLREGGHAVDALIAAAAVLSVVEPSASGLGGDAFFLVDDAAAGSVCSVNGSGKAPVTLDRSCFEGDDSVPLRSAASCTTPGAVLAWEDAWKRWGRMPWKRLLEPACVYARDGYPISWRMGRVLGNMRSVVEADPGLRSTYLHDNGTPLRVGEICRPESLGETLRILADEGAAAFYRGSIAERLCQGTQQAGGRLEVADLHTHASTFPEPYVLEMGDYQVYEQPLPSQGLLLLVMLGLVAQGRHLDARSCLTDPVEELHRQVESKKVAFALKEGFLTDPDSLPLPDSELVATLLSEDVRRRLGDLLAAEPMPVELASEVVTQALADASPEGRDLIATYEAAGTDPASPPQSGSGATDTTYLCAVDKDGNQVGLIQSIFHVFGSGFQEPSTGILLNNRACGFSLGDGHINVLAPGKRTLHTLNSYMIRKDGRPWLVCGTPGGDNQVQTNLQVIRSLLAGGTCWPGPMPQNEGNWTQARRSREELTALPEPERLAAALEAARWRVDPSGSVRIESRMPAEYRKRLAKRGHRVVRIGPWEGSGLVQAILRASDRSEPVWYGATDPRGEGLAVGI